MQMALWSIMSAPLFVSADVRRMRPESQAILLSRRAIAINQDPLGIMGVQVVVVSCKVILLGSVCFSPHSLFSL